MIWEVTHTDTFGGEANYCWVHRYTFEAPEDASQTLIMRRAKAAAGLANVRGVTTEDSCGFEFRPYNLCQILFVTWRDD